MITLVAGLPGSGKSYFAKRLSEHLGAYYLSSDGIRKGGTGAKYSSEDKLGVYEQMTRIAADVLTKGQDMIVDATFYLKSVRRPFYELAYEHHIPCLLIYIYAEEDLIKTRVSRSRVDSDADYEVYLKVKEQFEPISRSHLVLKSTDSNISEMMDKALQYIETSNDR
jgi:predicted kinase